MKESHSECVLGCGNNLGGTHSSEREVRSKVGGPGKVLVYWGGG